jgi:DNA replication protein DnaC
LSQEEAKEKAEEQNWTQAEVDKGLHVVSDPAERKKIRLEVLNILDDKCPEDQRLTDDQKEALREFMSQCDTQDQCPSMAVMGGPGVGKTFLTRLICKWLQGLGWP